MDIMTAVNVLGLIYKGNVFFNILNFISAITHFFIQIFDLGFPFNAPVFLLQDEKNQRMTTNVWMKQASPTLRKAF